MKYFSKWLPEPHPEVTATPEAPLISPPAASLSEPPTEQSAAACPRSREWVADMETDDVI
ncbi:MAG: hypothetical protein R3F19_02080 [Verrucomicrobiales bacterium]